MDHEIWRFNRSISCRILGIKTCLSIWIGVNATLMTRCLILTLKDPIVWDCIISHLGHIHLTFEVKLFGLQFFFVWCIFLWFFLLTLPHSPRHYSFCGLLLRLLNNFQIVKSEISSLNLTDIPIYKLSFQDLVWVHSWNILLIDLGYSSNSLAHYCCFLLYQTLNLTSTFTPKRIKIMSN